MSIIIRGMEMPKTCSDCEWSYYVGNGRAMCQKVSKTDKADIMTKGRAGFCPLIEVPPHSRLIDANKIDFRNDAMHDGTGHLVIDDNFINGVLWINNCINNTPSVIEEEE